MGLNGFTEDKSTGDWLLGDFPSRTVLRLDRTTLQTTTILQLGMPLTGMVQDPHRHDIYVSAYSGPSGLVRFDPASPSLTTLDTAVLNVLTIDRSPARDGALIYAGGPSGIIRYDRTGTTLGTFGPTGLIHGLVFDKSRTLAPELQSGPNDRNIRVSFPGDAGKPYVVALGLSGYAPGITLLDARVIPLNPDNLTSLTTSGSLSPLLTNNVGILDGNGEATVRFNANPLGNTVRGIRVWAAALTLDPNASLGIGQISGPLLFVL